MLARAIHRSQQASQLAACERVLSGWPQRLASCALQSFLQTGPPPLARTASSASSSNRWINRQTRDPHARDAKVAGLKSRAAFKLLEIHDRHRVFRPGDTVVDLGYAPGSWSQVAVNKCQPGGRVIGVDVIPVQPPRGVSTIQGDFLSPRIRDEVRSFVQDATRGRPRPSTDFEALTEEELEESSRGLIERGKSDEEAGDDAKDGKSVKRATQKELDMKEGRVVNVVLSDMCEPWPLVGATWVKSVSNPYRRMMNTSGMAFRDHAGSMDLCNAALLFTFDTLVTNGHFLCKFYQGGEDHALELRLRKLFEKVHRIKPDSSRKESREAYFVCLRRRAGAARGEVFPGNTGGE